MLNATATTPDPGAAARAVLMSNPHVGTVPPQASAELRLPGMQQTLTGPQEAARVYAGPLETYRSLGTANAYRQAAEAGVSLSAYLEERDPSWQYRDGLDSFERLMMVAGIRSKSVPQAGLHASRMEMFDRDDNARALFPEWASRTWRQAALGSPVSTRQLFISEDSALNTITNPYATASDPRAAQLAPAIPLARLLARTTGIDQDAYRAFYLTDVVADQRMVRVAQGAELPRVKVTGADRTINLFKYGRALEVTYEELRRQQVDRVAFWVQRLAIQTEIDKVATVIETAVNGDGNAGTAATVHTLTSLDSGATPTTLTLKAWLAFKIKFLNPYAITAALANEAHALQMYLLTTGNANIPLVTIQGASNFGQFTPINPELADNVGLGITADAPANRIVGMDTRFAVERVFEIGGTIDEISRWIHRQVQIMTFSEVEGYCIFDQLATRVLNLSA